LYSPNVLLFGEHNHQMKLEVCGFRFWKEHSSLPFGVWPRYSGSNQPKTHMENGKKKTLLHFTTSSPLTINNKR